MKAADNPSGDTVGVAPDSGPDVPTTREAILEPVEAPDNIRC
jgi:hypothetical protein